jgi:hypothetical protein
MHLLEASFEECPVLDGEIDGIPLLGVKLAA